MTQIYCNFLLSLSLSWQSRFILFIFRIWKPSLEDRFGWITYAMGFPSLILAVLLIVQGEPRYFWIAPILYCIWSLFGWIVDIWRPVEWREPKYLPIFIPYVLLFIASLTGFWVPLWFIKPTFWIVFAILYASLNGLIIYSHIKK